MGWKLKVLMVTSHILLGGSKMGDLRLDLDGAFLAQFDSGVRELEFQAEIPIAFAESFVKVLRPPESKSFDAVRSDITTLFYEAVIGLESGCSICSSVVAFCLSLGIQKVPVTKLHSSLVRLAPGNDDIVKFFYAHGRAHGSTFGLLWEVRNGLSGIEQLDEPDCIELANILALYAREAASVDVFDQLVAPYPLTFETGVRPPDRVSGDTFDGGSTDVQYYISQMKNNAEALSSALLFGITDVAAMLGLEPDDLDEEDLRESVERLSILDDQSIAEELLITINSVRHNLQVVKFNKGLEMYSKEGMCSRALDIHHQIVGEQSLFAKCIFLFLTENYYDQQNIYNALLNGLILSELGVESGVLSVAGLLEAHPEIVETPIDDTDQSARVMFPGKISRCSDQERFRVLDIPEDVSSCLDICASEQQCNHAVIRDTECVLYKSCVSTEDGPPIRVYTKRSLPEEHPCWPPKPKCLVWIHRQLALSHSNVASLNWLARYYDKLGDPREASEWSNRSAETGDPEGKFFSGYLHLKSWEGHPVDVASARMFFRSLISDAGHVILSVPLSARVENEFGNVEEMEVENARVIAEQLGLHDIPANHMKNPAHQVVVKLFAGFYGLILVQLTSNAYLLPQVYTLAALLPVVLILVMRRTYLD